MDVAMVRRLASPWGQELLRGLPAYSETKVLALQSQLRGEGFDPELVAALLTQSRLREKAKAKFGSFSEGMLFTADGLEQASRLELAAGHAGRFRTISAATVHDLGCGIGSDAMAMSALGITVSGVDVDPVTAAIADVNLRPWPDSRARPGRAEDFRPPTDVARSRIGVWFDPARRTPGVADITGRTRRVFSLDGISPSWAFVQEVAADVPATAAKLSPAFPHSAIPSGAEAQWTSYAGEVLECTMWWGPLVRHAGRTARILGPARKPAEVTEDMCEQGHRIVPNLEKLGAWLYEPDRAVIRAGLLGAVTAATNGAELDDGVGYVSADTAVELPFARRYVVHDAMPFSIKALRTQLRDQGVTQVTIKKRGVTVDEEHLRRQLKVTGRSRHGKGGRDGVLTLVLTRIHGHQVVLIVEPS